MQVDCNVPAALIAGLAKVCRTPEDRVARLDLRNQFPNAPGWAFHPATYKVASDKSFQRSGISIPSCYACLLDHESGTPPHWEAIWALSFVPRCPKHHMVLSQYCRHCLLGLLSVGSHSQHAFVVRCMTCFQGSVHPPLADIGGSSGRTQLVVAMEQALVSACKGVDPAPMWVGPVPADTFLAVVADLIWILMDAHLDCGGPATQLEISTIERRIWRRPFNLLSPWHRELLVAAVGVALLGARALSKFDIPLTVAIADLDSYPFFPAFTNASGDTRREMLRRFDGWPPILRERALRSVNGKTA